MWCASLSGGLWRRAGTHDNRVRVASEVFSPNEEFFLMLFVFANFRAALPGMFQKKNATVSAWRKRRQRMNKSFGAFADPEIAGWRTAVSADHVNRALQGMCRYCSLRRSEWEPIIFERVLMQI
jgi:hypothetical protein